MSSGPRVPSLNRGLLCARSDAVGRGRERSPARATDAASCTYSTAPALDGRCLCSNSGRRVAESEKWSVSKRSPPGRSPTWRNVCPAGVIRDIDTEDEKVYVNRTKDEIKNAPEFDDSLMHDDEYQSHVGTYYGAGGAGYRDDTSN